VRETTVNIGLALQNAMRAIEQANPIPCTVSLVMPAELIKITIRHSGQQA
jgi:hypothetical protein